jgi:hypothetical protein
MGLVAVIVVLFSATIAPCPDPGARPLDDDDDPFELGVRADEAATVAPPPLALDGDDPFDVLGWGPAFPIEGCSSAPRALDGDAPFLTNAMLPFDEDATPPGAKGSTSRAIDFETPF